MEVKAKAGKGTVYYMRATHRVLGYLALAMVLVYSLSGIVLIHRTGDMMKRGVQVETTIKPGLTAEQLGGELKVRNLKVIEDNEEVIVFADGRYSKATGEISYMKRELMKPLDKFVELHKMPEAKNKHVTVFTTTFGIVLFLLGITSLFMYKPTSKQFKRNMLYTGIGVVMTLILVLMV